MSEAGRVGAYMWLEFVCSIALMSCCASGSSRWASKLLASSATRGWNRSDLWMLEFDGKVSESGNSLSTKTWTVRIGWRWLSGYSQSDKLVSPANVVTGMSLSFIMNSLHFTKSRRINKKTWLERWREFGSNWLARLVHTQRRFPLGSGFINKFGIFQVSARVSRFHFFPIQTNSLFAYFVHF